MRGTPGKILVAVHVEQPRRRHANRIAEDGDRNAAQDHDDPLPRRSVLEIRDRHAQGHERHHQAHPAARFLHVKLPRRRPGHDVVDYDGLCFGI